MTVAAVVSANDIQFNWTIRNITLVDYIQDIANLNFYMESFLQI